jgi:hypothetical protein
VRACLLIDLAELKAHGQAPIEKGLFRPTLGPKTGQNMPFRPPRIRAPPTRRREAGPGRGGVGETAIGAHAGPLGHAMRGGHGNEPGNARRALWVVGRNCADMLNPTGQIGKKLELKGLNRIASSAKTRQSASKSLTLPPLPYLPTHLPTYPPACLPAHLGYPGGHHLVPVVPKWRNLWCHNFFQIMITHAFEWLFVSFMPVR